MGRGAPPWHSLPDEVWEHAFSFLPADADADRGAAACVFHGWLRAERRSRRRLTVPNCYATAPRDAVERFPSVRAAEVKGKPHFADFGLLPPWVAAAADGWPLLEELSFKRMVVTDECLEMIASCFRNFQVLRLHSCEGFTTAGLAAITEGCSVYGGAGGQRGEPPPEDLGPACTLRTSLPAGNGEEIGHLIPSIVLQFSPCMWTAG